MDINATACQDPRPVIEFIADGQVRPWPGYQGAAQHTWTRGCDGFHEPGQCPRSGQPCQAVYAPTAGATTIIWS